MSLKLIYDNFSNYLNNQNNLHISQEINEEKERLSIYSNNVLASKIDSVVANYPATEAIVGSEFFQELARRYAMHKDSYSGNLDDYGHKFPQFIKDNLALHKLEYLYDLALFELNSNLVDYYNGNTPYLNLDNYDEEQLMNLKLKLKASCLIQESKFPILSLFLFTKNSNTKAPNLSKAETILIYKDKFDIRFLAINETEHQFLKNFNGKVTLYDIFLHCNAENSFQSLLHKFLFCLKN